MREVGAKQKKEASFYLALHKLTDKEKDDGNVLAVLRKAGERIYMMQSLVGKFTQDIHSLEERLRVFGENAQERLNGRCKEVQLGLLTIGRSFTKLLTEFRRVDGRER